MLSNVRDIYSDASFGACEQPQNPNLKNACTEQRVYAPAARVGNRKAQFDAAKAAGPVSYYGPIVEQGLLGAKALSFDSYLRFPEVKESLISQESSDAMKMRERILRDGACSGTDAQSRKYLQLLCRELAEEKQQPLRYFQNVIYSLWNPYMGVVRGRASNGRALSGEVKRLETKREYKKRERLRLKTRRDPESRTRRPSQQIAQLDKQELNLLAQAKKHDERRDRHRERGDDCRARAQAKRCERDELVTQLRALKQSAD